MSQRIASQNGMTNIWKQRMGTWK